MSAHIGPLRFGRWDLSDRRGREGRGPGFALGRLVWLAAITATAILLLGIMLTWGKANPDNDVVHAVLRAGDWLATPFLGVFHDTNARERLTETWILAAAVYLTGGGFLSWLVGR
jgi:hypothetical protein